MKVYDPILCMMVEKSAVKANDESIKTKDATIDDFKKAIQMVEQIRQITRKYTRNIDANAIFAYCDKIQDKYQYYVDNAHKGWYG